MMQKLEISEQLRNKLLRVDSPISKYLLELDTIDDEALGKGYINYLGISRDNPDFISYMNAERIQRVGINPIITKELDPLYLDYVEIKIINKTPILASTVLRSRWDRRFATYNYRLLCQGFSVERYTELSPEDKASLYYNLLFEDDRISPTFGGWGYNRLGHRVTNEVSRIYKEISTMPIWDPSKRLHGKAGKTLRKLFGNKFDDKEWETFSTLYKIESLKEVGEEGEFVIDEYKGEKIKWAYNGANYCEGGGELGGSCMMHTERNHFMDFYAQNPRNISLAVLLKDNKIASRCLLWRGVRDHEQEVLFDRIYATNDKTFKLTKACLENRGYKDIWDLRFKGGRSEDNKGPKYEVEVERGFDNFKVFPYLDTFRYITGNILCSTEGEWRLDNHSGGTPYRNAALMICPGCGRTRDEDRMHELGVGVRAGETLCEACCEYSDYYDEYIANSESTWMTCVEARVLYEDLVRDYEGVYRIKDDCVQTHSGQWVHVDDDNDILKQSVEGIYFIQGDEKFTLTEEGKWTLKQQEHDILQ